MRGGSKSETITENIFREFYGNGAFIEKSAIPSHYGFKSKKGTGYKGYPDFFRDNANEDFVIIVEAKADDYKAACEEVEFYAKVNKIDKDILAIAISGQTIGTYKSSLFIKFNGGKYKEIDTNWKLLPLESLRKIYRKEKIGDCISDEKLHTILSELNNTFHEPMKIKDTERSLFFAGLMIALKDTNFRITYKNIQAPTKEQQDTSKYKLIESHNLNKAIIEAIVNQINNRINSYSKEINWKGQFAFILDIDYELKPYKELISKIEKNIFTPFEFDEKQDILGKAYKIFLSRAGKIDNKNIILTPDHIKHLMVRLARLSVDDIVLDTCTGTGGFLMEAMEVMSKLAKGNDELIERIHRHQLYGFEIDRTLFALACSNMFLHGDGRSNMIFGNSLIEVGSKIYSEFKRTYKPRKCIINPPYEKNLPIKVVENEAVHTVARERPLAADREQAAPVTDDLHLISRTQVLRRPGSPLDGRFREKGRIFGRIDDTLHAPVELRSQRSRIGGDGDPQIGIAPQQVGGQQGRSPDALAMLGRHGDDKPADAPGGECLQYAVVGLVKPPELQKGIDSGGKQAERRQIPRRSRFCGGQVLQYIYIHRSVVFKLRPVARRCRREAEGFDTHGSAGFQNRRIRQSQNSVQLFERQRKNGTARCSGYRKPRTMCSEKDRRRRRSGWDVRSCGVESEEVLLKLGKGEIVGAFPRLVGCMEFPPDGNQVVDSIGVAFGQTLLRTIDYDRGDETTLFRTVVE